MGRGTIRRSGSRSLAARLGVGKGVVGATSACLPVSLCVSVFTSAPPPSPQLSLPRIHRPSPGLVTGPRPAPASKSFPPRGHAAFRDLQRAQLDVREAGEKAGSEAGSEPGKPEPGAPSEARGKGDKREVCAEFRRAPRGRRQERSPPRRSGRGDARTPGDVPGGVTGRAGVEAAPAVAATNTSGLASSACHPAARSSPCACRRRLALMRSSAAPRVRPRPPALALPPAGPGSLVHFSFSEEDTCWYPPGRSVRWVARGQSPPLLCFGAGGAGSSLHWGSPQSGS